MGIDELKFYAVIQEIDGAGFLGEVLGFPEFSTFSLDPDALRKALSKNLGEVFEHLPPSAIHGRLCPPGMGWAEVGEVAVAIEPTDKGPSWPRPVEVRLPVIRASRGEIPIAYVPALGIEVLGRKRESFDETIAGEIRFALARRERVGLLDLAILEARRRLLLEPFAASIPVRSPKSIAQEAGAGGKKSLGGTVYEIRWAAGTDPAVGLDAIAGKIGGALAGRRPRSVLLVGKSGVGKSAAVAEVIRRSAALGFGAGRFWATGGPRIVAGASGFGMWQERCRDLLREAAEKKAILCLGNLAQLAESGRHRLTGQGVADLLRPAIARGEVLAIAECLPEEFSLLERESPSLIEAFLRIDVEEPTPEKGLAILRGMARTWGAGESPDEREAIETASRLHRR